MILTDHLGNQLTASDGAILTDGVATPDALPAPAPNLGGLAVVDPDGIEHSLSGGDPLFVLLGLEGLHMPPVDLIEEAVPRQPGGRLREVRFLAREIDLPLRLVAATPATLAASVRTLLGWFNPTRAVAPVLRFTAPDGAQREITVRYVKGLDFNDDLGAWRVDRRTTLVLRAHDPFWYDRAERGGSYRLGEWRELFFPLPPLRLTPSTVFAGPTIANEGDADAWPVWRIAGPGVNPTIRNLTTGKVLTLAGTLLAGQTLTIDTRPRTERAPYGKTLRLQDGANWLPNLAPGSALWPLARGANAVQIELAGATSQSAVSYTLRPPFLSI